MKKIKLLTPILGLTALTSAAIPTITSCACTTKHVWLSSVHGEEKTANDKVATYYFGLDKDTYVDNDINIKIISENADDFKITWYVSANVLVVNVQYTKEIPSGTEGIVSAEFKIRIKSANWSNDFDLKININAEVTLDDFMKRYTEIYNNNIETIKSGKKYSCKLAKNDLFQDKYGEKVTIDDPTNFECIIERNYDEDEDGNVKIDFMVRVTNTQKGKTYDLSLGETYDPVTTKFFYALTEAAAKTIKYSTPSDGSLSYHFVMEESEFISEESDVTGIINKDMIFTYVHFLYPDNPDTNCRVHISDIQEIQ